MSSWLSSLFYSLRYEKVQEIYIYICLQQNIEERENKQKAKSQLTAFPRTR